ncbi:hypothetical protein ACFWBC_15440 [Streptomyces sp. NPDC059985]|uniref:hypothetical protein n=1 Tax=Streptomyces sp. NPDC059985 TaxID=3347025 RepID=UPI00369ACB91
MSLIETAGTPAQRLPAALAPVTAWLAALQANAALDADIRLAALVHRSARAPEVVDTGLVPTAIELLQQLMPERASQNEVEADSRPTGCAECTRADVPAAPAADQDVPPQLAAALADFDRHGRIHAPTTELLTTLHGILDTRIPERTALLTAQLRSPDQATRYDATARTKERSSPDGAGGTRPHGHVRSGKINTSRRHTPDPLRQIMPWIRGRPFPARRTP